MYGVDRMKLTKEKESYSAFRKMIRLCWGGSRRGEDGREARCVMSNRRVASPLLEADDVLSTDEWQVGEVMVRVDLNFRLVLDRSCVVGSRAGAG